MRPLLKGLLGVLIAFALIAGGLALFGARMAHRVWSPDPETIASASLEGLRAENRLTALVAGYVAVVTSTQHRFGLSAERTLIMPGRVRYEVDLGRMKPGDLIWHKDARTLDVVLPPLMLEGPDVDPARIRAYDGGGLLLHLTDSGEVLDDANRKAAHDELLRQAREPAPVGMARDAARRAVAQSFALPLKAAGLEPQVRVRFADEADFPKPSLFTPMDHSRSVAEVLGLSR